MRRALEPLASVNVVSVHSTTGVGGIIRMLDAPDDGSAPLFPKLESLTVHMRMKCEDEDWHIDCWEAIVKVLDHRKRAGVPVRELRITGGWMSNSVSDHFGRVEAEYFIKVREAAVKVVRDERIVKRYEMTCECCDTDLEFESDDE